MSGLDPGRMADAVGLPLAHEPLPSAQVRAGALPPIDIGPGSVVRLAEGMRTVWVVRETLRKVYITPCAVPGERPCSRDEPGG